MAGTNFKVKNGLEIQSGTVIAGGGAGTNGQVLSSTGTGVQWVNAATGTGDVVGPASSTDNAVVRFDGTTGKLIQNSTAATISDSGNADFLSTKSDYFDIDTTATTTAFAAGRILWNAANKTASLCFDSDSVQTDLGQTIYAYVTNADSTTINLGDAVYLFGATGNRASVKKASSSAESTSSKTLGLAAMSIAPNNTGMVITQGTLGGLTLGSYTAGDTVYLGTTAGTITNVKPSAPTNLVVIGIVERANNGNGQIYVKVQNGFELSELHDVSINGSLVSGNTLIYDAPNQLWKNASITAGTGISVTNGAASITIGNTGVTSVSGTSPVVSSGTATPAISLASGYGDTQNPYGSKTANYFLAAPDGSAGSPTFRAIVAADIPTLNQNTTGTAANITATSNTTLTTLSNLVSIGTITTGTWNASAIGVAYGGTGLTSLTAGRIPYGSGTSAFGSSANLFWDSTNSRLGIGTATPADKLQIAAGRILLDQDYQLTWQNAGTNRARMYGDSGNNIIFENGSTNTERMRITSAGQLIIGNGSAVASPSGGTLRGTDGSGTDIAGASLTIQAGRGTGTGAGGSLLFFTAAASGTTGSTLNTATEKMRLDASGNLGLGTSSPISKLHVYTAATNKLTLDSPTANDNRLDFAKVGTVKWSMYSPANSNDLRMYDHQTVGDVVTFQSGGNVGIGTTTPSQKLEVANGYALFGGLRINGADASVNQIWQSNSGTNLGIMANGGAILFGQTSSEQMRLTASGSLGIGTTNPVYKVQIEPTTVTAGGVNNLLRIGTQNTTTGTTSRFSMFCSTDPVNDTNGGKVFIDAIRTATNMDLAFSLNNTSGAAPVERMRLTGEGNLGIGTSSPSAKLTVNSGANRQIYIGQNTSNTNYNAISLNGSLSDSGLMGLAGGGTGDETLYVMSQGNMVFRTVGTNERMRIDSNGNVGIGTSTVVANFGGYKTLELNGTTGGLLSLDSNGTNNLQMYTNGSTVNVVTIGALPLTFGTNSTERMRIDSSGNVGIGTSSPTNKLQVNGVMVGNNASGSYTKGFGGILTTTSTSTPTGGSSGDFTLIY